MLRRFFSFTLAVALMAPGTPAFAARAAVGQATTGQISGTARNSTGQAMPNMVARLRNVQTVQLAGSTTTNGAGQFSFTALNPGTYVVEVVNSAGNVVATSATISLTMGAMAATGVSVTAPAVGAAAAAAGAGGVAGFFGSTAGIVTLAAVATGTIFGVHEATKSSASTSR